MYIYTGAGAGYFWLLVCTCSEEEQAPLFLNIWKARLKMGQDTRAGSSFM
jgi:hypothetical protein